MLMVIRLRFNDGADGADGDDSADGDYSAEDVSTDPNLIAL